MEAAFEESQLSVENGGGGAGSRGQERRWGLSLQSRLLMKSLEPLVVTVIGDGDLEGASVPEAMLRKSQECSEFCEGNEREEGRWCWGLEPECLRGWQCPRWPQAQQEVTFEGEEADFEGMAG